jgi:CRP/FNR family transcriptional regulator, cyclic AMP receptor protein
MGTDPLFARFGREFAEGHVLFREGDAGSVMYVIHTGRVRITRAFASGERTLAVLSPGDFFGEMAILNQKPRTATAVALDDVQLVEINARTLEAMVLGNTEIAVRLITRLARRLDSANELVELLLHPDVRVRVVLALTRLAEELGLQGDDGVRVPVTIDEIARAAALDERDVEPVLHRLASVRMLSSLPDGGFAMPTPARMREFLDFIDTGSGPTTRAKVPSQMPLPVHGTEAPRGGR